MKKKKVDSVYLWLVTAFLSVVVLISCANPLQDSESGGVVDTRNLDLNYKELATAGYMGGKVLYAVNDNGVVDTSISHLQQGVIVGVRTGKVKVEDYSMVYDAGQESGIFVEDPLAPITYGYIKIEAVNEDSVTFVYQRFSNMGGIPFSPETFTVRMGEEGVDINHDGALDISYEDLDIDRPGIGTDSRYLNFISSQSRLNTTYFSVLPEQYPDKNYPSGLVGINPNGKWLVNRYKVTNGVEIHGYDPIVANDELIISDVPLTATAPTGTKNPTIKSLVRGDYIIDNYAGNYYSVMNPNDESSLVPMTGFEDNSSNTDDWNFYKWDIPLQQEVFTDLKESLVEVFKDGSKQIDLNNVTSIDELISFLNDCIADETSLKEALGSFTIDDDEALAQIPSNQPGRNFMLRAILENRFQDTGADNYILPVNLETKSITAALPLVSVQVTDNLDYEYDPNFFHGDISEERDLESSVRSVSEARAVTTDGYQNYLNTRSTANAEFEANFKEMVKLNVAQKIWAALKDKGKIKSDSDFPLSNVKTEVRLGLAGGGNNVWGNVEMTVGAAVFIQMEITFNVNFDCTNLFGNGLELLKYTGCFAVGPVVFQIECPITFNLDMGIGVETGRDYFAGYTGLYGGKATAGVNYDAIWWWKIPYDYWANAYASGEPWTTTAIYFGPKEKGSFKTAVTGRLTPKLTITPSVALYGIIWGKLPATVGVPVSAKIQTTPLKLSLIGDLDFELRFEAGVGFKILIFDFYKGICNTELAKWRIRLFDRSYNL